MARGFCSHCGSADPTPHHVQDGREVRSYCEGCWRYLQERSGELPRQPISNPPTKWDLWHLRADGGDLAIWEAGVRAGKAEPGQGGETG
jgi:hypothetical protein